MRTDNVINAIERLKSEYLKASERIAKIEKDAMLSQAGKDDAIARVKSEYVPAFETLRTNAIESVESLKAEIREQRKNDIIKGLEASDEIALVTDAIKAGSFEETMLEDILDIYKENRVALTVIRGALENSGNESYRNYALQIPKDKTESLIKSFDKLRNNLEAIQPYPSSMDDALLAGVSGLAFDSMIDFLRGVENGD